MGNCRYHSKREVCAEEVGCPGCNGLRDYYRNATPLPDKWRKDEVEKVVTPALIEAARQYLRLGNELSNTQGKDRDMIHPHSKLGIALEEVFGVDLWRAAKFASKDRSTD